MKEEAFARPLSRAVLLPCRTRVESSKVHRLFSSAGHGERGTGNGLNRLTSQDGYTNTTQEIEYRGFLNFPALLFFSKETGAGQGRGRGGGKKGGRVEGEGFQWDEAEFPHDIWSHC